MKRFIVAIFMCVLLTSCSATISISNGTQKPENVQIDYDALIE